MSSQICGENSADAGGDTERVGGDLSANSSLYDACSDCKKTKCWLITQCVCGREGGGKTAACDEYLLNKGIF